MGGKQRIRPVIGLVAARSDDIFSLLFDRLRFDFDDEFRGEDALQTPAYRNPPADPWNLPWRRAPEPSSVRLPAMQRALATKLTGIDSTQDASEKLAHGPSRVFFSELDRSALDKEDTALLRDWSSYWKMIGARVARAPAHLVCVRVADNADPAEVYAVLQALMADADTEVVTNLGLLTDLTSDHLRKWTERIAEPIGLPDPMSLHERAIWSIKPPLRMRKVEEWVASIDESDFQPKESP